MRKLWITLPILLFFVMYAQRVEGKHTEIEC